MSKQMSKWDFMSYASISMPECELRTWVIEASTETGLEPGERLFWNNADGWGCASTATRFTEGERLTLCLPIGGFWQRCKLEKKKGGRA